MKPKVKEVVSGFKEKDKVARRVFNVVLNISTRILSGQFGMRHFLRRLEFKRQA
jgi:hypothetical protein